MASEWAQVPGASRARRRSSGRPRSDSSSRVRSVVIRVADSAIGITIIASEALAGAISPFPQIAGVASALLGFLQMGIAAAVAIPAYQDYVKRAEQRR